MFLKKLWSKAIAFVSSCAQRVALSLDWHPLSHSSLASTTSLILSQNATKGPRKCSATRNGPPIPTQRPLPLQLASLTQIQLLQLRYLDHEESVTVLLAQLRTIACEDNRDALAVEIAAAYLARVQEQLETAITILHPTRPQAA